MDKQTYVAWTFCLNTGRTWYLSDLKGCDGRVKNPATPNSDYGHTSKECQALKISEYEWKQYAKYQNEIGRQAFCSPS